MSSPGLTNHSPATDTPSAEFLQHLGLQLVQLGYRGRIQRVDITKSGELMVQLSEGGQLRWLSGEYRREHPGSRVDLRDIVEMTPGSDDVIALSRQLNPSDPNPGLTVLSYSPRRRLVVLDHRGAEAAVLKGYRHGRVEQAAAHYEFAARANVPGRFYIPGPTQVNPLHDYLAMPFANGKALQISDDCIDDFEELGLGLRGFQALDAEGTDLKEFKRRDELDVIDERARRMRLVGCSMPAGWSSLRERLEAVKDNLPGTDLVPVHRDLHDGQVLRGPQGISLLDFDLLVVAEPELAPANFLAHLSLRRLQMPQRIADRHVQSCGNRFLDGLDLRERSGFWERLRFYQATCLCRLQLVYSLRPKWVGLVDSLGYLGHRCLDDLQYVAAG